MRDIELTDKERLMLANQYQILGILKNDAYYTCMAESLASGHPWLYKQIFDNFSENLSDAKTEHVLKILEIYGVLKDSYNALTDQEGIDMHSVNFPGFDGNNEIDLLSFAEDLIKHGRFSNTLGATAINSHMQTTDMYERMIERWVELGRPGYPYSKEVIMQILAAKIHPENR